MAIDPVHALTVLLREANAIPRIRTESFPLSSMYDSTYRAIVVGLTLEICAKKRGTDPQARLADAKVKLFQFVAVHPDLMPSLRGWLRAHEEGKRPSLDGWARFPRGYAADTLYERVVAYLVSTGELGQDGKQLWRRQSEGLLSGLIRIVVARDAFTREREILTELGTVKLTMKMLNA
jgi:hypothetical protein